MALRKELDIQDGQGHYQRWALADGDVLHVDFSSVHAAHGSAINHFTSQSYFVPGVPWLATPGAGCTLRVAFAFRPDAERSQAGHWLNHGVHPEITEATGYREDADLSRLRFTADGGPAIVEIRSQIPLRIS